MRTFVLVALVSTLCSACLAQTLTLTHGTYEREEQYRPLIGDYAIPVTWKTKTHIRVWFITPGGAWKAKKVSTTYLSRTAFIQAYGYDKVTETSFYPWKGECKSLIVYEGSKPPPPVIPESCSALPDQLTGRVGTRTGTPGDQSLNDWQRWTEKWDHKWTLSVPKEAGSSVWRVVFEGATDEGKAVTSTVAVTCEPGGSVEVSPTLPKGIDSATFVRWTVYEK